MKAVGRASDSETSKPTPSNTLPNSDIRCGLTRAISIKLSHHVSGLAFPFSILASAWLSFYYYSFETRSHCAALTGPKLAT